MTGMRLDRFPALQSFADSLSEPCSAPSVPDKASCSSSESASAILASSICCRRRLMIITVASSGDNFLGMSRYSFTYATYQNQLCSDRRQKQKTPNRSISVRGINRALHDWGQLYRGAPNDSTLISVCRPLRPQEIDPSEIRLHTSLHMPL